MTGKELQGILTRADPPLLVHVLPEEIFTARRIPGSRHACVYEMAFLDQVAEFTPDKQRAIVVYGAGGGSLDAAVAAEKLTAAGYLQVRVFEGGLEAWSAAGLLLDGEGALPAAPVLSGAFRVDTAESIVRWTGRNLFNHHSGIVRLADGDITLRDGELLAARFRIAMETIACEDIADSTMSQMLVQHLHSQDFFDVAHHPVAEFVSKSAQPLAGCTDGTPNYLLRGNFTLRGITHELEFPILVATADGRRLTAQGVLDLDRTQFGSSYGSGRLFRFLGKHLVNDHVHLHLKVHADLQS